MYCWEYCNTSTHTLLFHCGVEKEFNLWMRRPGRGPDQGIVWRGGVGGGQLATSLGRGRGEGVAAVGRGRAAITWEIHSEPWGSLSLYSENASTHWSWRLLVVAVTSLLAHFLFVPGCGLA